MNTYGSREGDAALREASGCTRKSQDAKCKYQKSWSSLAAILPGLLLFAGCRHAEPRFAEMSSLTAPTASRTPYAVLTEPSGGIKRVTLTNQFDPAWLQPPNQLFTLG